MQSLFYTFIKKKTLFHLISNLTYYASKPKESSLSWSYRSWIYNYLCKTCLSLLKLCLNPAHVEVYSYATLCDNVCQWLATGRWLSSDNPVSSKNKPDRHNVNAILLNVAQRNNHNHTLLSHMLYNVTYFVPSLSATAENGKW